MAWVDFCVFVLTEDHEALESLKQPKTFSTPWGPAVRGEDAGRLYWSDALYVRRCNSGEFLRHLPSGRGNTDYYALEVNGDLRVGPRVASESGAALPDQPIDPPLSQLLEALCIRSPTWAMFFMAYCEDMAHTFTCELPRALEIVGSFVTDEQDRLQGGFKIISN